MHFIFYDRFWFVLESYFIWSNSSCLHNSRWIAFPTQSCLLWYCFLTFSYYMVDYLIYVSAKLILSVTVIVVKKWDQRPGFKSWMRPFESHFAVMPFGKYESICSLRCAEKFSVRLRKEWLTSVKCIFYSTHSFCRSTYLANRFSSWLYHFKLLPFYQDDLWVK